MNTPIVTALITASGTLLAALLTALFKLFSERKAHAAAAGSFVSTGLAVGYYYNFIRPVFERLTVAGEIKVSINQPGSDAEAARRTFKTDNVELQIIFPAELTEAAFRAAQDATKKFRKGSVLGKNGERDFAIQLTTAEADTRLVIQDVASPLKAVRQYLQHLDEFKDALTENGGVADRSPKFHERQTKEIENFIAIVKRFARQEGFGDKRISFKPV
jgi:hypothetical protein